MARFVALLLVLGGLACFFAIHTQGVDRAFGGALARFTKHDPPRAAASEESPRRPAQDWWEKEDRPPPQGIGQRVRDRVDNAMDTGARRHSGE